ncbi:MAG TPA: hypothetical protein VMV97_04085 [Sulfuriferula sp.]|nr:hypothetical protein [Sulfuriferula sp.]
MSNFFENIPYEDAEHIDRMTKLTFELREYHLQVLERHDMADEAQLKQAIIEGAVPEHASYEDYLSASILDATREAIRDDLNAYLKGL